jgi:hypothetical protein
MPEGIQKPVLKKKPWWLRLLTPDDFAVTIYPNIYLPAGKAGLDEVAYGHEFVHWAQQEKAGSIVWWIVKYLIMRPFRREMELVAFRTTIRILVGRNQWTQIYRTWLIRKLSGLTYFYMMSSKEASKWVDEAVKEARRGR